VTIRLLAKAVSPRNNDIIGEDARPTDKDNEIGKLRSIISEKS